MQLFLLQFSSVIVICSFIKTSQANTACLLQHKYPEECLAIEECSYCIQEFYSSNRCNLRHNLLRAGCLFPNIIDDFDRNNTVTPGNDTEITLPVVPGRKTNITITWQLARHPLDLYYLMDFSGSMSDDKKNVVLLADKLVDALANVSSDSALGFGSFVDKPITPFGSSAAGDYSFRNNLKLMPGVTSFGEMINAIPIRSGDDGPESQGDGMYQVAACSADIGWRPHARHLLLVATDYDYHRAGDGLTGGITTPFDGQCHLDITGKYTEELKLDYPSDEQLISAMSQNDVAVIFAVTAGAQFPYQELAKKLQTSAVGVLSSDSSNVVDLILDEYEKISSRFEMVQSNVTGEIRFKYFSDCNGDSMEETIICEALSVDGTVTFTVEVDLVECPIDVRDWKQTVRLHPLGLPTYIDIALALICRF